MRTYESTRSRWARLTSAPWSVPASSGKVLCGGSPVASSALPERCRGGLFYQPTVIGGLAGDCRVEQEEIFGPVVTVSSFDSEEEALARANGTPYGLAASVWTQNLGRAHRFAGLMRPEHPMVE